MSECARILLVEDEPGLIMTIQDRLRGAGYIPEIAPDGNSALQRALSTAAPTIALVILDIMLPDMDGFEVCRRLRKAGLKLPIIMLTARTSVDDKVFGLKAGADDYLAKPFSFAELLARLEALLRRNPNLSLNDQLSDNLSIGQLHFGQWELDIASHTLRSLQGSIPAQELSAAEFRLLHHLVSNPERIFTRQELLDALWGYNNAVTSRTVDVHIAWLRRKLHEADTPIHIHTIRRSGYCFKC